MKTRTAGEQLFFGSRHKAELHILSYHPTDLTNHFRTYTLVRTVINEMIWKAVASATRPGFLLFILAKSGSLIMENDLLMENRPGGPQMGFTLAKNTLVNGAEGLILCWV